MKTMRVCIFVGPLAALASVAACSSNTSPGGTSSTDAGSESSIVTTDVGDAGIACPLDPSRTSIVRGRVTILDGSKEPPPAPGATVCILDHPELPCAVALADGTYEHTCVPEGDVGILFTKEGVGRTLWLRVMTAGIAQEVLGKIATKAENQKLFAAVNVTYPRAGHGMITINDTQDSAGGGIHVTPVGSGDGPYYSSDGEKIDGNVGPSAGIGIAFIVAPTGKLEIQLTAPSAADGGTDAGSSLCGQVQRGWGSNGHTITVPVLEDTETDVNVRCL